jgi:SAM-dependent methyltransferase
MPETPTQPNSMWQLEPAPCDYCGSHDAQELFRGPDRLHGLPGEFGVVACRQCGLVRTSPRPTLESLGAAYPQEYRPYARGPETPPAPKGLLRWALVNCLGYPLGDRAGAMVRVLMSPIAAWVLAQPKNQGYLPYVGGGRLLDFGCGAGGYVARMAAAGWDAQGMDMSPEVVQAARAAGLTVQQGTLPGAQLPEASFDTVTLWQVIEHMPSPKATLLAVHRLLRPGGQLLVVCPDLESSPARKFQGYWYGLDLPRHLTHFSRATLRRHVEAAGFEVMRMLSRARPAWVRKSWGYLAADAPRWRYRFLSRSRLWVGLGSRIAHLTGRGGEIFCVAWKAPSSGVFSAEGAAGARSEQNRGRVQR